jgi:hypothetical protein
VQSEPFQPVEQVHWFGPLQLPFTHPDPQLKLSQPAPVNPLLQTQVFVGVQIPCELQFSGHEMNGTKNFKD